MPVYEIAFDINGDKTGIYRNDFDKYFSKLVKDKSAIKLLDTTYLIYHKSNTPRELYNFLENKFYDTLNPDEEITFKLIVVFINDMKQISGLSKKAKEWLDSKLLISSIKQHIASNSLKEKEII